MGKEYLKAKESDFEELVDFINYVFSHSGGKTDFPTLLPKLYRNNDTMKYHHIMKEEGKIKGVVCSFPLNLNLLGENVKVAGIGSVAVHPYSEGKGYMKELMTKSIEEMKNENVDMSVLSGYRQRYEHFGYEPCGEQINFNILDLNINYKFTEEDYEGIMFEILDESKSNLLEKAYKIHSSKTIKVEREREKFLDIAKSWNATTYSIYKNYEFIGYISSINSTIFEVALEDNNDIDLVIASYIKRFKLGKVNLRLGVHEIEKISKLMKICENYSINTNNNFRIFNYEKVVGLFLKLKATYSNLADGECSIDIENYGVLNIKVINNNIEVKKIEEYKDELSKEESAHKELKSQNIRKFHIELGELEAMNFIFSPLKSYFDFNKDIPNFIQSWFPLPLYIENLDCV